MRFLRFVSCVSGLAVSACCFYMNLSALTITPGDSFYRVQVPYSARYQGIVIEPMPDQDPTMITIVAFKAKNPQDQGVQTGSAVLDTVAGQAITCNTASWLPWSSAEYHIHAYRTDLSTSECQESLNAPEVISIRAATAQELKVAHEKERALKKDIYAPLFLQSKIQKRYIAAAGVIAAGVVVYGERCAWGIRRWHKFQKTKKRVQAITDDWLKTFNGRRKDVLGLNPATTDEDLRRYIMKNPNQERIELRKIDKEEEKTFTHYEGKRRVWGTGIPELVEQKSAGDELMTLFVPLYQGPGKVTVIEEPDSSNLAGYPVEQTLGQDFPH